MTRIAVQSVSLEGDLPDGREIRRWARAALAGSEQETALTIRIADLDESRELNRRWRGRNKATNVLAFPSGEADAEGRTYLGDIVICAPVVRTEAREQGKQPRDHFAHLVIHGVLHLLGYDHQEPGAASAMEDRETRALARLGIANPYIMER
ncbi:MAG: rRNA maturation RNase YbeY [Gammaproteobacteria bacterium]|nr:MAG: rRNA maturation RNase YbeY [Gammaproteobacteria bacterium]